MNIQTNPAQIEKTSASFPAITEEPIRSTFLPEERLRLLGESLAKGDLADLFGLIPFDFQARIRDSAKKILEVYRSTNAAQAKGETITPAAQWLLDNNYLVEETIFQVKRDLPRRFYRQLPTLKLPDGGTVPRALALAWTYVAHSDSSVSATMSMPSRPPCKAASRKTPSSATICSKARWRALHWSPTSNWSRTIRPATRSTPRVTIAGHAATGSFWASSSIRAPAFRPCRAGRWSTICAAR